MSDPYYHVIFPDNVMLDVSIGTKRNYCLLQTDADILIMLSGDAVFPQHSIDDVSRLLVATLTNDEKCILVSAKLIGANGVDIYKTDMNFRDTLPLFACAFRADDSRFDERCKRIADCDIHFCIQLLDKYKRGYFTVLNDIPGMSATYGCLSGGNK